MYDKTKWKIKCVRHTDCLSLLCYFVLEEKAKLNSYVRCECVYVCNCVRCIHIVSQNSFTPPIFASYRIQWRINVNKKLFRSGAFQHLHKRVPNNVIKICLGISYTSATDKYRSRDLCSVVSSQAAAAVIQYRLSGTMNVFLYVLCSTFDILISKQYGRVNPHIDSVKRFVWMLFFTVCARLNWYIDIFCQFEVQRIEYWIAQCTCRMCGFKLTHRYSNTIGVPFNGLTHSLHLFVCVHV